MTSVHPPVHPHRARCATVLRAPRRSTGGALAALGRAGAAALLWPAGAAAQLGPAAEGPRAAASIPATAAATPAPGPERAARPPGAPRRQRYVVPVVGYAPETGAVFGAAAAQLARPAGAPAGQRPSTLTVQGTYTTKRQATLNLGVERWTRGNGARYAASAQGSRVPFEFYGVGRDVPDRSELYTPRLLELTADAQWRVLPGLARGLYVGAGALYQDVRIDRTEEGGLLRAGAVAGSRGGARAAATASLIRDTRDNIYASRRGDFVTLSGGRAARVLGGDFAYTRATADARLFRPLGGRASLAVQGVVDAVAGGAAPFDALPALGGGALLRGNLQGRYRDRTAAALQAELRSGPVFGRLGAVAFAGVGDVAPRAGGLSLRAPTFGVGGGVRWLLSREDGVNLRVDFAAGRRGSGTYFGFGEAF